MNTDQTIRRLFGRLKTAIGPGAAAVASVGATFRLDGDDLPQMEPQFLVRAVVSGRAVEIAGGESDVVKELGAMTNPATRAQRRAVLVAALADLDAIDQEDAKRGGPVRLEPAQPATEGGK